METKKSSVLVTDENFSERDYLASNPDVAQAVREGRIASGKTHFYMSGRQEGRTMYLSSTPQRPSWIAKALSTGMRKLVPQFLKNEIKRYIAQQFPAFYLNQPQTQSEQMKDLQVLSQQVSPIRQHESNIPIPAPDPQWSPGMQVEDFPVGNDEKFRYTTYEIPIPSPFLRSTVGGPDLAAFLYIGSAWAAVCQRYLPVDRRVLVLDMGCGVGRTARFLVLNSLIDYCGFDVFMPAITWCKREFPKIAGERFRFEHFNGISAAYNPKGTIRAAEYVFPVPDGSVDLAFAGSLFTHLYEEDARHYFEETSRVLKKGGIALFSIHSFEDVPFFFPDATVDSSMNTMGSESVMLVRKEYFAEWGRASGLAIKEAIGRLCGQETFAFQKL